MTAKKLSEVNKEIWIEGFKEHLQCCKIEPKYENITPSQKLRLFDFFREEKKIYDQLDINKKPSDEFKNWAEVMIDWKSKK